jgi:hypothetical protein
MTDTDPEFILRVLRAVAPENTDDLWWRCDGTYGPVTFFITCNDEFYPGGDCEAVTPENIHILEAAYEDCRRIADIADTWAHTLFVARVRGQRPRQRVYPKTAAGILTESAAKALSALLDACGDAR